MQNTIKLKVDHENAYTIDEQIRYIKFILRGEQYELYLDCDYSNTPIENFKTYTEDDYRLEHIARIERDDIIYVYTDKNKDDMINTLMFDTGMTLEIVEEGK